jgi:hypothetical protein
MTFSVEFSCKKFGQKPIEFEQTQNGLLMVDMIREDIGLKIPIERIPHFTPAFRSAVTLYITEKQARETQHFDAEHELKVFVHRGFLNEFVGLKIEPEKNEETGEVKTVNLRHRIFANDIWEAWKDAGFPIEWD